MILEFYLFLKSKNPNALYLLNLHVQLIQQAANKKDMIKSITSINCCDISTEEHVAVMKKIKNPSRNFEILCFKGFLNNNKIQNQELVDLFPTIVLLKLVKYHCNPCFYSYTAQHLILGENVYSTTSYLFL